ncbi:MAG: AGE family epimerase/isomerase [Bacteroidota bacterium]
MNRFIVYKGGFLLGVLLLVSCSQPKLADDPLKRIDQEMAFTLEEEMIPAWYPRVLDTIEGGYLSDFDADWKQMGQQRKMIVTQARHVWTAAKLAEAYPENDLFIRVAAHGIPYLAESMWDNENGGFYTLLSREGDMLDFDGRGKILKHAYGNAFAIYGLAAYVKVSGDTSALHMAQDCFHWLEDHSHDAGYKGYFQFLEPDGTPLREGFNGVPPKDQNSSIHLLEAFTELYHVWPDSLLKVRLEEMLVLIRDTIAHPKGYLRLFSYEDWTHLSYEDSSRQFIERMANLDHVSFGHDIETAYLLMEAAEVLYGEVDERTLERAKIMTDHSLRFGYDETVGGLYDEGYYFQGQAEPEIIKDTKNWWAQSETLNTLQIMAELYPDDPMRYEEKFIQQWAYIQTYLVDHTHGGWYIEGIDKKPGSRKSIKSGIWKGAYHTVRSLLNCLDRGENNHE